MRRLSTKGRCRRILATEHPQAIRPENPDAPLRWLTLTEARDTTSEPNLREALTRIEPLLRGARYLGTE